MRKISIFILLILIAAAFGAGIYFKDDFLKTSKQVGEAFQKINVDSVISEAEKKILAPSPLKIGGTANQVVLLKSKIIIETNLQRKENGNLPALTENKKLDEAAAAKANDMFLNQYFEHVSPSGLTPGQLVQDHGYDYILAGENLILGNFDSEKEVLQDWMNSPGHRANILNNRFTEMGAAIIKGTYKGETVWIGVQEFGLPLASCPGPSAVLKNQIDSEKSQLDAYNSQITSQKSQIENTNQNSDAYRQMVNDYNQLVNQYNALAGQVKQDIATYNKEVNAFNACVTGK